MPGGGAVKHSFIVWGGLQAVYLIEAETKWLPFSRRHFQMHFLEWKCIHETVLISIKISLKFVPKGLIDNIPALG